MVSGVFMLKSRLLSTEIRVFLNRFNYSLSLFCTYIIIQRPSESFEYSFEAKLDANSLLTFLRHFERYQNPMNAKNTP